MFISYAQNFEDVMLWRALRHVAHGFYVDVGAQDPVVDSVSLGFYEQGWRGVHVEPVAGYADLLRTRRPDEQVIQAALAAARGAIVFYEVPGTGLSTANRDVAQRHRAAGLALRETEVRCLVLDDVLARCAGRDVHWLKIDAEGLEEEVLAGWTSDIRPWVVVIESTSPLTQMESHRAWENALLARGYEFAYFDGLNRFYVSLAHAELLAAFRNGPTVFDGFALSGTATAPFSARLNARIDELTRREREADARATHALRQVDAAEEHARRLERRIAETEQRARDAEMRHRAAEAHIAAMTGTISWRVTTPLRWLRGRTQATARVGSAGLAARRANLLRLAVVAARRWGAFARLAPWVRERYPGLWLRAKRALLDTSVAAAASVGTAADADDRAPLGTSIPHYSDLDDRLGGADRRSVTVQDLVTLIEDEVVRRRRA